MMYGGTCINVGCIPTKFLVHRARDAKFAADKQAYYQEAIEGEFALTGKLRGKNLAKAENAPNVTVISDVKLDGAHHMLRSPNCPFVLFVGTKKLVKRREFEQYISQKLVI